MKISKLCSRVACAVFAVAISTSVQAAPVFFDFAGGGGDLNTNTLMDNGVTADSFYWDGNAWLAADLFQRIGGTDNGLGVCSPPETTCQNKTGNAGGGNINELSNLEVYEVIRFDKGGINNTKWAELWVSSLDNSEVGTLFWGNSSDIDTLLGGSMFSYDSTNFGTAVEGDILTLAAAAGFNNTAQYVLFTPGSTALATGTDNDYLVWKGATDDAIPPSGVPIPASVWLFGSGLLGLLGIARRRKGTV